MALGSVLMLGACSRSAREGQDSGAQVRSDVEAAIMEGRTAARSFINTEGLDTMAIQEKLMDARARQSSYASSHQREAAEAFDTAFISTLRTVRPDLARDIESAN